MIRSLALLLALVAAAAAGEGPPRPPEQGLLLPLPELTRSLDPATEWLLVPQAEWAALLAAAAARTPDPRRMTGPAALLASAAVTARIVDGADLQLSAAFTVLNRSDGPALAPLFAADPPRLGRIELEGQPAVLARAPARLLVPRGGRFSGVLHWSVPLDGDLASRSARVPLPLCGALSFVLAGAGAGRVEAPGLVADGEVWRLASPPGAVLDLRWSSAGGDDAAVFGAEHDLAVQLLDGPSPVSWTVRLDPRRGRAPRVVRAALPPGMACTRPIAGVVRMEAVAEGVELTLAAEAASFTVEGLLAAGAAIALPRLAGAAFQPGTVAITAAGVIDAALPPGWRPLGASGQARRWSVMGPDAGIAARVLPADAGIATDGSTVVAVGPAEAVFEQTLRVRAGAARIFALPLQLPPAWRPTGLRGDGIMAPAADELPAGGTVMLDLPGGLAPGAELVLAFTARAETPALPPVQPLAIASAVRASNLLRIAAAPGIELDIAAANWRPVAQGVAVGSALRAELTADGPAPAVTLRAARRDAAVEATAVCWLLPAREATWVRLDLRLAVRDGEATACAIDLPLAVDADLRLSGEGLSLSGSGPFIVAAPAPWRGERLLRLEGRLRADAAGALPVVGVAVPGQSRPVAVRRLLAMQAPPDRDVRLEPGPAARPIDADELPTWSSPIPGAAVAAAWRLADGAPGGWQAVDRALAPLPGAFIDRLVLDTQVSPEGARTRLACRLAAGSATALPLGLPEGAELEQAVVDGTPARIRREGADLLVELPGRTGVDLELRWLMRGAAGRIALPRFTAEVPVTGTSWRIAVDPVLRAEPVVGGRLMPLSPLGEQPRRDWFAAWTRPPGALAQDRAPPAPEPAEAADPRALAPLVLPIPIRDDAALSLAGRMWAGERVGVPEAAVLRLTRLDALDRDDLLGRVIAALLGLLACLGAPPLRRVLAVAAVAALPLGPALVAWQQPFGPLLACAEALPPAVLAGLILALILRQRSPA